MEIIKMNLNLDLKDKLIGLLIYCIFIVIINRTAH